MMLWLLLVLGLLFGSQFSSALTCDSNTSLSGLQYVQDNCNNFGPYNCNDHGISGPTVKTNSYYDMGTGTRYLESRCVVGNCVGQDYMWYQAADPLTGSCGGDFGSGNNNSQNEQPPTCKGSIVSPTNRTLGEIIPLQNSTFDLVYSSDRTRGFEIPYSVKTNMTGTNVRSDITDLDIEIYDESNTLVDSQDIPNTANQSYTYTWDGLDASNNDAWATKKYKFKIIETYSGFTLPVTNTVDVGGLNVKKLGLGGWAPSVWMFYDSSAKILHLGNGGVRKVTAEVLGGGDFRIAEEDGSLVHIFNSEGLITSTKLGKTGTTIYSFTYSSGRLTQITEPHSLVTTFTYSMGNLTTITNAYSQNFSVDLDANGYLEELTTPGSQVYEMTYSAAGLLLTFEKPNGAISEFTYDADGLLEKDEHSGGYFADIVEEAPYYHTRIFSHTSKMGRKTLFQGDGRTYSQITTRPDGGTEELFFSDISTSRTVRGLSTISSGVPDPRFGDTSWFPTSQIRFVNSYYYVTENRSDTVILNTPTDPFSIDTWTTEITNGTVDTETIYDGSTQEYNTTTAEGRTYRLEVDTYERPVEEQIGSLTKIDYTYTGKNLTGITQGARSTALTYNGVGLLSSVTNDLSQTTSYAYDSNGNLDTVTLHDSRIIDYNYDSVGRLTSVTPDSRSAHVFAYNASELLEEYAPPLIMGVPNVTTDFSYNDDNQLTLVSRPDGKTIEYNYGSTTGLLDSIDYSVGTTSFTYGSGATADLPTAIDGAGGFKQQRYYVGGKISSETAYTSSWGPVGQYSVTQNYYYGDTDTDTVAGGSSGTETVTYGYDDDRVLNVAGVLSLTYSTPSGTLASTDMGLADDAYSYNSFGEVISYDATYNSVAKYSLDFVRDDLGRISEKTEMLDATTNVYEYTYDSTGRLTQVEKNSSVVSTYSYDDNNNRTGGSVYGTPTSATYGTQDQMTDYNMFDYTYNANGDLETKTNTLTTEIWTYSYDEFGNLLSVLLPNTDLIEYEIDGFNRRVGRKLNGTVTVRYIYDGDNRLIGEVDDGGALIRRYVYASKSNVPDYFIEGGNEYRMYSDHLGSLRIIVKKSDGTIMQKMNHDEFGRVIQDTNPGYTPFGFAGGVYDPETGLVRFGARDYDPETGRWTSKDPILFDGDGPNLYGYVMNDPVNLTDPTGLSSCIGEFCSNDDGGGSGNTLLDQMNEQKKFCQLNPSHEECKKRKERDEKRKKEGGAPLPSTPAYDAGGVRGSNGGVGGSCRL